MRLRNTIIIVAIVAVAAAALAASGSARPVGDPPTMSKIAYFNYDARDFGFDIMLVNTDGSDVQNISHDATPKKNVDPNWSFDGLLLAFTSYTGGGNADIMVVHESGKGLVNITGPGTHDGIQNVHPTWAPNGSIVFASNRDGNFDLYRIASLTGALTRLTKTEAPIQNIEPDYSADGKLIVFSRISPTVSDRMTASLYWMPSTPGPAIQVTKPWAGIGDRGAAWSPDGRQIAFYSDRTGNNDLYVVNRNGTSVRQLTTTKSADREPTWSPDGTTLSFLSDRSGYTELWMTSLMGAGFGDPPSWQITFDKELKGAPDWQPIGTADR